MAETPPEPSVRSPVSDSHQCRVPAVCTFRLGTKERRNTVCQAAWCPGFPRTPYCQFSRSTSVPSGWVTLLPSLSFFLGGPLTSDPAGPSHLQTISSLVFPLPPWVLLFGLLGPALLCPRGEWCPRLQFILLGAHRMPVCSSVHPPDLGCRAGCAPPTTCASYSVSLDVFSH